MKNLKKIVLFLVLSGMASSPAPMLFADAGPEVVKAGAEAVKTWSQWTLDHPLTLNPYSLYQWIENNGKIGVVLLILAFYTLYAQGKGYYYGYFQKYGNKATALLDKLENIRNKTELATNKNELLALGRDMGIEELVQDFCKKIENSSTIVPSLNCDIKKIRTALLKFGQTCS